MSNAFILFATQGISGTTVTQIAKASGVTSAMVHYYFANREGLLDALVAERIAPAMGYIWESVTDNALANPREFVKEFVHRLLETVEKMPHLPLLWNREIFNAGGRLRGRVMALPPWRNFDRICQAFAEAQRRGQMHTGVEPALVLPSIMSVVMLPLAAQDILGTISAATAVDLHTLKHHALTLLLEGLCPEKQ